MVYVFLADGFELIEALACRWICYAGPKSA